MGMHADMVASSPRINVLSIKALIKAGANVRFPILALSLHNTAYEFNRVADAWRDKTSTV